VLTTAILPRLDAHLDEPPAGTRKHAAGVIHGQLTVRVKERVEVAIL